MSTRRIESFLLRLVVDDQHGADAQTWCGRIQHVASGCERHFDCLQEILVFIGEQFDTIERDPADDTFVEGNSPTNP